MMKWLMAMVAALGLLAVSACGDKDGDKDGAGAGGAGKTPIVLRCGGIPNKDSETLKADYIAMGDYLAKELGITIEWVKVSDYNAAVDAIVTGKADMVWLGGHTAVITDEKMGEDAVFVACRDLDLKFTSYYICNKKHIDALKGKKLADLAPMAKDMKLAFGSKGSTSGHLMPRHFLMNAGLDPENSFKEKASYTGDHSNTLKAVADGTADIGALDMTVWDKASDELKKKAPVFLTSDGYTDYVWVANKKVGEELINKVRDAMLKLDMKNEDHAKVLKQWSAGKFINADRKYWDDIRAVRKTLLDRGILSK